MPLSSRRSSIAALALLTGCVGVVGEGTTEYESPVNEAPNARDAGKDASKDATTRPRTGRVDGGDDLAASNGEPPLDEEIDPPLDQSEPDTGSPDSGKDTGACANASTLPLANGIHLRHVGLYQAVKIPLVEDGEWQTSRPAPVVQGKKALVRVSVDLTATFKPHEVRGVLTLDNDGTRTTFTDQRAVASQSDDAKLDSTFNFEIPGEQLTGSTKLGVKLEELSCSAEPGKPAEARFPADDELHALDATAIGKLKVVVVPVKVDGRVPVTSASELANMRAALLAYYPVPDVEVTVRAPLEWPSTVEALDGQSWSNLLNQLMRERRTDAPDGNVYYFGLVQPAATFRAYCLRGCVLGLAPQTTSVMASAQVALGASFADAQTYETMVHELGHAHGRGHAPCVENGEIDGVDPKFPDDTGRIGDWGWDSRTNSLQSPSNKDIMGYCEPNWIGAYNYAGLASRSASVNGKPLNEKALFAGVSDLRWHHVLLYGDQSARWGGSFETRVPAGSVEQAKVLDAQGHVIDEVEVVRIPLSHTGDQFLYIPEPGKDWIALQLSDQKLELTKIKPAL